MAENQVEITFPYNRRFLQLFLIMALIGVVVLSTSYYQGVKPGAGSGLIFGIALFAFFRKHIVVRLHPRTFEYQVTPMGTKHVIDYEDVIGMTTDAKTIRLALGSGETKLNIPLNLMNVGDRQKLIEALKERVGKRS